MDDDVVVDHRCLEAYSAAIDALRKASNSDEEQREKRAFYAGSKCDVSNTRNYPNFSLARHGRDAITEHSNHSLIYDVEDCWGASCKTYGLDTGNALLHLPVIKKAGVQFRQFAEHGNSSGDATAFWLWLHQQGCHGIFVPSAVAYHLEKPGNGFNEFEARREMLLRLCDLRGFDKGILKTYWMPESWPK